eukprot:COSAG02_NODE_1319_length_13272_cov_10.015714_4_plen_74_part_00
MGQLGAIITERGGNVGRSKQIVLGSQFCLMIEISIDKLVQDIAFLKLLLSISSLFMELRCNLCFHATGRASTT